VPRSRGSTATTSNGLNQQATIGGSAAGWDAKGNITTEPQSGKTYGYSSQNQLTSASGGVTLAYDPALRLQQVAGAATTRFAYDDLDPLAEYDGGNALQRRFVFGPGMDEPIVQYEGSGTTDRRFIGTDERGSIISLTDSSGALIALNRYDEYGRPQATNSGRFQYTSQRWLSEAGLYDYKARAYLPHLGIFGQTDPIGYAGSPNLYAYVLNDPVNLNDPFGLGALPPLEPPPENPCPVIGGAITCSGLRPALLISMGRLGGFNLLRGIPAMAAAFISATEERSSTREKPKPTQTQCLAFAAKENGIGLSLDLLGGLIEVSPVGRVAKAIGASIVGVIGIGAGIAEKDAAAAGAAYAHKEAHAFGLAPTLSKVAGRISLVALAYSTVHDLRKTAADYQACMSGKAGP